MTTAYNEEYSHPHAHTRLSARQRAMHRLRVRSRRMFKRRLRGESCRQWVERNLKDSEAGVVLDCVHCIFGMIMVVSIIAHNWRGARLDTPIIQRRVDYANLFTISVDLSLHYYAAANRKVYVLQWQSMVDICCWVTLIVSTIFPLDGTGTQPHEFLLRLLFSFRITRILQLFRLLRLIRSAKVRQGTRIALAVFCIIVCAAAGFQTIEYCDVGTTSNCQDVSFFDSMYFVCITIGTVGYGELAPKSKMGRVSDIFLIVFAGLVIPIMLSGYTEIISRETAFDKRYTADKLWQHVLLCGDIEAGALKFFMYNWLSGDGERSNRRKAIILSPQLPSSSVRRVLLQREFEQRVVFLQGSAMDTNDLKRAGAPTAALCFVMGKKHTAALDQNDTAINLITCSVRKNNNHAPLFVQVAKADNIRHINISGASSVLCLTQLRLAMCAKSLFVRGLNTFLGNLVQRFEVSNQAGVMWFTDYLQGCLYRIYEAAVPHFLYAMPTFRSLAQLIYRECGVPLIALRTAQETVMLYPVHAELSEVTFHTVFIMGTSPDCVTKIEKMTSAVFSRHSDISPNVDLTRTKSSRSMGKMLQSMGVAALEGTLQQLRSITPGHGDGRASLGRVSLRLHASNSGHHHASGMLDKVTPVHHDDQIGESGTPIPVRTGPTAEALAASSISTIKSPSFMADSSPREYTTTVKLPVVALSPAELIKKASTPLSPEEAAAVTPRSPRMTSRSPRMTAGTATPGQISVNAQTSERASGARRDSASSLHRAADAAKEALRVSATVPKAVGAANPSATAATASVTTTAASSSSSPRPTTVSASASSAPSTLAQPRAEAADGRDPTPPSNIAVNHWISTVRARVEVKRRSHLLSIGNKAPPHDLTSHYVICGVPNSYHEFLSQLPGFRERQAAVVFVTPQEMSEQDSLLIMAHANIYYVRRSPLSHRAIEEARMLQARSILIMSNCGSEADSSSSSSSSSGNSNGYGNGYGNGSTSITGTGSGMVSTDDEQFDENMADVHAITTYRFITEVCRNSSDAKTASTSASSAIPTTTMTRRDVLSSRMSRPTPFIVVEMIRPSNVKFLVNRMADYRQDARQHGALREVQTVDHAFFSPLYAGGHIYFAHFMDALLGASAHNGSLIEIVTQLVASSSSSTSTSTSTTSTSPNSTGNPLASATTKRPRSARSPPPSRTDGKVRDMSGLTQIPIPARYQNRPYALLVEGLLVNENTMALGLYRAAHGIAAPAHVLTNPPANEIVHPLDLVFVIK